MQKNKIMDINRRTDIDNNEKCRMINELMMYNSSVTIVTKECTHYEKNCMVFCDICDTFFNCRFCHDDHIINHDMDRFNISKMKCNLCGEIQECNQICNKCNEVMGKYYCDICHLFSNRDDSKPIIHCDKCGICRVCHIGEDMTHCDECHICFPSLNFETHKCIDRYADNCPFCNEEIKTSTKLTIPLQCMHLVHNECLQTYINSGNYQCPICKKSIMNMTHLWEKIQGYVDICQMPEEYQDKKVNVLCNDCLEKSNTQYHFAYHQCGTCKSWNTSLLD